MKKHTISFLIGSLSVMFCGVSGMEKKPKSLMVERKATVRALSKLAFTKNEKIVHVGPDCEQMIRKTALTKQVYCIDVDTLTLMRESAIPYDKILTFACWDVVKDPFNTFVNSARVLKSGGQFCGVLPYYDSPYLRAHYQTFMNDTWKDFYDIHKETKLCGSKKIKELLKKAGLGVNVTCDIIKKPFIFKTKEKFMAWVESYSAELNGIIPQERQKDFCSDIIDNYLAQYPIAKDNSIKLYLPYMIVIGHKS